MYEVLKQHEEQDISNYMIIQYNTIIKMSNNLAGLTLKLNLPVHYMIIMRDLDLIPKHIGKAGCIMLKLQSITLLPKPDQLPVKGASL